MSRLDELIQEYCPDGVEYRKLGDITTKITDGMHNLPKTANTQGEYPVISAQNINNRMIDINASKYVPLETYEKENARTDIRCGDILLTIVGALGRVAVVDFELKALFQRSVCVIKPVRECITPKYLGYVLESSTVQNYIQINAHGAAQKGIYLDQVSKIEIPVPPLPVQEEIVRILGSFTVLTAELTAKLTSELTARKKQYEYYRNRLLFFDTNIRFERLGATCIMKSGKAIASLQISAECTADTPYKCYGGNGIRGYVADASHHGEFPIIGRQGALCGNVNYATGDFYATEHAVVVKSKGDYLQRFLYYLLTSMNLNQYKSQGAQPGLAVGNLENLVAPVPALDVQKRLVNVLDNFEAICSDLNIGLPAEIEARKKQYEFYREQLLTFAEGGRTVLTEVA